MPWVQRDEEGRIIAVHDKEREGMDELHPLDRELQVFLNAGSDLEGVNPDWLRSDLSLSRVLEDLVDVLIEKRVITFTDLPESAQKKLIERRGFRKEFAYVETLFGDGEGGYAGETQGYDGDGTSEDDGFL